MKLAQNITLPGGNSIEGPSTLKYGSLGEIISALLPILLSLAGLILFLYLLWGGYDYLLSGGDPGRMDSGRQKITNAIIGFIIVFIAYFLTQLIAFIFGLEIF